MRDRYLIPGEESQICVGFATARTLTHLDSNLLIHALLPLFYLLLQLLQGGTVRRSAVGLENLNVPVATINMMPSSFGERRIRTHQKGV